MGKLEDNLINNLHQKFVNHGEFIYNKGSYPATIGEIERFLRQELLSYRREIAEDICIIIDDIEAQSDTNTLEEWKQYKGIRNAIRDKYVLKIKTNK